MKKPPHSRVSLSFYAFCHGIILCSVTSPAQSLAGQVQSGNVSGAISAPIGSGPGSEKPSLWVPTLITARDACSSVHETTQAIADPATGEVINRTNRFIEVATGLNYRGLAGEWLPSQDLIELAADGGAEAVRGPTKVHFNANLNIRGAIRITTISNRVVRMHPLCLAYYDASSGQAVVLARLQSCAGELLLPNQIVYKSAFGRLADVRYTYTKAAFESDVILREQPPSPELYGLDPRTTRLEVWHEWLDAPPPRVTRRTLVRERDPALRALMVQPDLVDEILSFGEIWFPTGAGYASDGGSKGAPGPNKPVDIRIPNLPRNQEVTPVVKTWLSTPDGCFLVESVRWRDAQRNLRDLPMLPAGEFAKPQPRTVLLGQLSIPTLPEAGPPVQIATNAYRPVGYTIDWIEVTGYEDYTFETYTNGNTYLLGGTYFQGTVTIQAGAVLKYARDGSGRLLCFGSFNIQCGGLPAILTSEDDDEFGDKIPGSTGCPSCAAEVAIWDYFQTGPVQVNGVVIRWASTAVQLDANADPNDPYGCSGLTHVFWDSGIEFCRTGISLNNGVCDIGGSYYAWKCAVQTPTAVTPGSEVCSYFSGSFFEGTCSGGTPPTATTQSAQMSRNTPGLIILTGSGACGGALSFSIVTSPTHGELGPITYIDGNSASVIYTPSPDFCGLDTFTFSVADCAGNSQPAQVSLSVGDAALMAQCREVLTGKGQSVQIALSGSDACNDALTFSIVQGHGPIYGNVGSVSQNPPNQASVTYTPSNSSFEGQDGFDFAVASYGFNAQAHVTIHVVAAPVLTAECLPRSIRLRWTLPQMGSGFIKDFKIYRCSVSSGTCTPGTSVYATVDDPGVLANPSLWTFVDTAVQPGTVYCYRVSFRHQAGCDLLAQPYESPYSNTDCTTTCCPESFTPFWTDCGPSPEELAQWVVGPEFTISGVQYSGARIARGTFGNGSTAGFPIDRGVIFSSGDIALAKGPNDSSRAGVPTIGVGDSGLDDLLGANLTRDAAVLEFDVTSPASRNLTFHYIFASEEYPEFSSTQFTDIMAIFIDGVNVATIPGTSLPVTVNYLNGGWARQGGDVPATNPQYYQDNHDPENTALPAYAVSTPVYDLQYDGTTLLLTAQASISGNVAHHIRIAIADVSDQGLDSAVFISAEVPCP